jgi:hypothetical protein
MHARTSQPPAPTTSAGNGASPFLKGGRAPAEHERSKKRDRLQRPRPVARLLVAVSEILSPDERAALDHIRDELPDEGEDTGRWSERERLIACGLIRPLATGEP